MFAGIMHWKLLGDPNKQRVPYIMEKETIWLHQYGIFFVKKDVAIDHIDILILARDIFECIRKKAGERRASRRS